MMGFRNPTTWNIIMTLFPNVSKLFEVGHPYAFSGDDFLVVVFCEIIGLFGMGFTKGINEFGFIITFGAPL